MTQDHPTHEGKDEPVKQGDEGTEMSRKAEHHDPFSARVVGRVRLTPEQKKARQRRNLALAFVLVGWMLFTFLVTIFKLKDAVFSRPL